MSSVNDILQELRGLESKLADMPRTIPYEVPAGYFDALPAAMLDAVKAEQAAEPVLNLPKAIPYEVPVGYFEGLAKSVMMQVQEPSLPLTKEMSYEVPAGYFENLPAQVIAKAKQKEAPQKASKTIAFPVWKTVTRAAAAILVIGIGFGSLRYLNADKPMTAEGQLAALPKDSINEYVQLHIDEYEADAIAGTLEQADVTTLTNKLSAEEIENYLNETGWD